MNHKTTVLLMCTYLLAGCSESASTGPVEQESGTLYDKAYAAAVEALAEAEAKRNVWSKTESLLDASQTAYGDGRIDEAIELATEARLQAELASTQAETEKEAWRSRVLTH